MSASDDDDSDRANSEESVGYGKPPRSTQFKPGRSGNPGGRPKRARNLETEVTALLDEKLPLKGGHGRITTKRAMLLKLRERALAGNQRALEKLYSIASGIDERQEARRGAQQQRELMAEDAAIIAAALERMKPRSEN